GVLLRPLGDRAGAGDDLAVVEDEDRHLVGAGQLADLLAVLLPRAPGPGHHPVAADRLQLVLVTGRLEGVAGFRTRMGEAGAGGLGSTGVEDHASHPSRQTAGRLRLLVSS